MMPGPWDGCYLAPDANDDMTIWRPMHREPIALGRLRDLPEAVAEWVALLLEG